MVVQHNMQAMNANRMLGITAGQQAKSTEKLSSGYKINRAADNAAGLAISEKMRKQIRGLDQASSNAQDGISAVQTAEGALNEVQDMLQRMNELAVQAANGTNSVSDRKSIQDEIDQLTTEIDRVSETTKFNEAYLLKGDSAATKKYTFAYGPSQGYGGSRVDATWDMNGQGDQTVTDDATGIEFEFAIEAGSNIKDQNAIVKSLRDQGFSITAEMVDDGTATGSGVQSTQSYGLTLNGEIAKNYSVNVTANSGGSATFEILNQAREKIAQVDVTGAFPNTANDPSEIGQKVSSIFCAQYVTAAQGDSSTGDVTQYYDKDGNAISANALKDYFTYDSVNGYPLVKSGAQLYDAVGNFLNADQIATNDLQNGAIVATPTLMGDLKLKLHVGADATTNNQITINLQAMSSKGLGVNGLRVDGSDDSNALDAIETIKSALSTVSAQRSELGAAQNRLEHTIANLDNIVENTTSAESAIRDTDMAEEMVKYSKSNILAQAGQSMLAQANQSNQGVLSLLG